RRTQIARPHRSDLSGGRGVLHATADFGDGRSAGKESAAGGEGGLARVTIVATLMDLTTLYSSIRPASSALSPKADTFNDACYMTQLLRTASPEFPQLQSSPGHLLVTVEK